MANESTKWLYEQLTSQGYNVGEDLQEFEGLMQSNEESRKWAYDTATKSGLNVGKDIDEFTSLVAPAPAQPQTAPQTTTDQPQTPIAEVQPLQSQVADTTTTPAPTQEVEQTAPAQPTPPPAPKFNEGNVISRDGKNYLFKGYDEQGNAMLQPEGQTNTVVMQPQMLNNATLVSEKAWQPTEKQKIETSYNINKMLNDFNEASKARIEQSKRIAERNTPEGREKEKALKMQRQMSGEGMTYEELAEENKARAERLQGQFIQRMKSNGLDPEKQEDVERQATLDLQQPAYDAVAELWDEAERLHKEDRNKNAKKEWGDYAMMGGGREMRMVTAGSNRHKDTVSHMTRFDIEKMMNKAWDKAGSKISATVYDNLRRSNPEADEAELKAQADEIARQLTDNAVYEYAVKQNTPKSTLEFFGRTVADMNLINSIGRGLARSEAGTTGDLAAYEQAMAEYGKKHKVAQVAGTVVGMAVDPTTWISGGVGSISSKGALNLGSRFMMKEASREAAKRAFGSTLTGRIIAGTAGAAGNLATYEGMKEGERQWMYGGHINPETGENEGYSPMEVLKSTGHGAVMGSVIGPLSPVIGNVADKTVKLTNSTGGKLLVRGGEVAVSTLAEGTIFSIPQWIEGEEDAFDVWTDNMAMMLGFKAQHGIKSVPHVIQSLRPIKPTDGRPLTQAERNHNRMDFMERLRNSLDGNKADLSFTEEERDELRRNGYGELGDLFTNDSKKSNHAVKREKGDNATAIDFQTADSETIHTSPDFEGYSEMEALMSDPKVSEATKAKAYYILTGRMLPMSTIVGYNESTTKDKNGKETTYVESVNADGGVVTSRKFTNRKDAEREMDAIARQAELNSIDIGERYKETEADDMVLNAAINEVSPGADLNTVKRIYQEVKNGGKVSESQRELVEFIDEAIERNKDIANDSRPEAIRNRIKEETGIDVDKALKKSRRERTEEETQALEAYAKELFPERQEPETSATPEQEAAQNIYEETKLLPGRYFDEQAQQPQDPNNPVPPSAGEAKAEMDAIVYRMQEAYQLVDDVFGDEADIYRSQLEDDPFTLVNDPTLTPGQKDAVLNFINSKAALDGVMDGANEAAQNKLEIAKKEIERRTNKGDSNSPSGGMIVPAVMKVDDKPVYIVNGDVSMFPDGSDVDRANSSGTLIILDPADPTGEYKWASVDEIKKVDEPIDPQVQLAEVQRTIEEEQAAIFSGFEETADESTMPGTDAREEGTDGGLVPENADLGTSGDPNVPENVPTESQNVPNGGEIVPNGVENVSPTNEISGETLSKIPIDEATGKPKWHESEPKLTYEALVEKSKGNEDRAKGFASMQLELAKKAVKDAEKIKITSTDDFDEYDRQAEERQKAIDQATAIAQHWERVLAIPEERKAAAEAEEKAIKEAEEAERQALKKADESLAKAYDEVKDVPEALEHLKDLEPKTMDEVAALVLSQNRLMWNDEGNRKGVKSETGFGEGERRKMFSLFAPRSRGGKTLQKLAEDEMQQMCETYGVPYDNQDARNALIDMISSSTTPSDIRKYIERRRADQALEIKESIQRREEEAEEEFYQMNYGMSKADHAAYEEMKQSELADLHQHFDEEEYYGKIADELADIEEIIQKGLEENDKNFNPGEYYGNIADELATQERIDNERRDSEIGGYPVGSLSEDGRERTDGNDVAGGEILPGKETDQPRGFVENEDRQEIFSRDGQESLDKNADVSGNTRGTVGERIAEAEAEVNTQPTEAQKEAGNYKKGHVRIGKFDVTIENPKGSVRSGVDTNGKEWSVTMQHTYGYIRGTKGVDGDHIDVFLKNTADESAVPETKGNTEGKTEKDFGKVLPVEWNGDKVFVIDQYNPDGTFDEHKVMLGFNDKDEAYEAYLSNYEKGWENGRRIDISTTNIEDFEKWIDSSKRKTKPFAEYKTVKNVVNQFQYFTEPLNRLISIAKEKTQSLVKKIISPVSSRLQADLLIRGIDIDNTYKHVIDNYAINHALKKHGGETERKRGQIPLEDKDFEKVEEVVANYDSITIDRNGSKEIIKYQKTYPDGTTYYIEEVRSGRKELAMVTMYKHKNTNLTDENLNEPTSHTPKATSDLTGVSESKGSDNSEDRQIEERKVSATITPTTYTNKKGKTSDISLVKFSRDLTDEEREAAKRLISEPLRAGKKTPKGWYDRNEGGYMMRSEEAAKELVSLIDNPDGTDNYDKISDNQPLSREDLIRAIEPKKEPESKKPANEISIEEVVNGEEPEVAVIADVADIASPGDQPAMPNTLRITDEMKRDEDLLRDILGIGEDEVDGNVHYRLDELTPEQRRKVYAAGVNYSIGYIEQGIVGFEDFARAMSNRLGEKIKPWLKSFYEGVKRMPGYEDIDFTPTDEVDKFDIDSIGKPGDIFQRAETKVEERKVENATKEAEKELIAERNEQRKQEDEQTTTNTKALEAEAKSVGKEADAIINSAKRQEPSAEEINNGINKIDDTLNKINEQLGILGYYESGYPIANIEKRVATDGVKLTQQLALDLNINFEDMPEGKDVIHTNFNDKRGLMDINLPIRNGYEPLQIEIAFKNDGQSYKVSEVSTRLKRGDKLSYVIGYDNRTWLSNPTYKELLDSIKESIDKYLPKAESSKDKPTADESAVPETNAGEEELATGASETKEEISTEEATKQALEALRKYDNKAENKTVKPEATIGSLFNFEEDSTTSKPVNPKEQKDGKRTEIQSGSTYAGRGSERQQPRQDEPLGAGPGDRVKQPQSGRVAGSDTAHTGIDKTGSRRVSGGSEPTELAIEDSNSPKKNTRNFSLKRGEAIAPLGESSRIKANIAAIEKLQELIESGRQATPEEMKILSQYSGWGGLGSAFNERGGYSSYSVAKRLKELLGAEGFQEALKSTRSAFYTPAEVINPLWDLAKALGFKGGKILEGSAGIGNMLALMPRDISEKSDIQVVEIDPTTGGILAQLYPDAQVDIQGFEKTRIPNNSVDLAITNVPFVTGLRVTDDSGDKDLSRRFGNIHDFAMAKNVRKLKPGGLGIFITSAGTLDGSRDFRKWLVNEGSADVIGAFRLNNKTFGGTNVTSDIIVVRKRKNGRPSSAAIDVSETMPVRTAHYSPGRYGESAKDVSMSYNRYFVDHPEHMAGEMQFNFENGETFRATSTGLFPKENKPQEKLLEAWAKDLKDRLDNANKEESELAGETPTTHDQKVDNREREASEAKEGALVLNSEGRLAIVENGEAVELGVNSNKVKGYTKVEVYNDYTAIKSALDDLLTYQTENEGETTELKSKITELNKAYDTFVNKYGHFYKNNQLAWLRNDIDYPSVAALETVKETADKQGNKVTTFGKTDIFSRRVVEKEKSPQPQNVRDGVVTSISLFGELDIDYISKALGKDVEEVKKEIIESGLGFENPEDLNIEVSYQYLSGNVRDKLEIAKASNEGGKYDRNIQALERVKPLDIPAHLIEFSLGSTWLPSRVYDQYIKEKTGLDVTFHPVGGTWVANKPYWTETESNKAGGIYSKVLDKWYTGSDIIEAAMKNKTLEFKTTKKNRDGSTTTLSDPEATAAVGAKVDEYRQDFKDWLKGKLQEDPAFSNEIAEKYNYQFNNYVPLAIPEEFVPQRFPGSVTSMGGVPFALRPHQSRAVIKASTEPVLFAHEVGTGKTFTLITSAMEMRRLGLAQKPMIVVQNATLGQFVESAKQLYPNAKILTLTDKDRTKEGRLGFYAKIKYNDWDMIVVPQSVFDMIPDSPQREAQYISDKIEEKRMVLDRLIESGDGRDPMVRRAQKELEDLENQLVAITESQNKGGESVAKQKKRLTALENAEARAKEMLDRKTDAVENFDDMGIDAILVDEAHEYKHLGFSTAMQRGVKGVDPSYSKKAQGLYLKTQAVRDRKGNRNIVFATGTPISNTAAEVWTFMRYLMPEELMKDYDIYYFDDFVRNFGSLQQMLEFTTSGKFKENNRFAGYTNLPELARLWSSVADIVLTSEAGAVKSKIPSMEEEKAQDIYLPQTQELRSIMKYVKSELQRFEEMTGAEKRQNSHIPLTMYGIANAAAIDPRLVKDGAVDEPNSKTNEAVRQTLRALKDSEKYKGTVAIFSDKYQNQRTGFNLYEDIKKKLVAEGVPEERIAIMKPGMKIEAKQKLFDKVNNGEVRVILGSTQTLGTGVNIQERLFGLIHLDAPNRPMDYWQRMGRILRQGNLFKEWGIPVRVLRFGVEDSLDVTAYQRLKTKGAIADSIMHSKDLLSNAMENRVMEEEEDVFGDTIAQLSGSEYAMLKSQAEKQVRKLEGQKKSWQADQMYVSRQIPRIKDAIEEAQKELEATEKGLQEVKRYFPESSVSEIKIGNTTYSDIEGMSDFFKEYNSGIKEAQNQVRGTAEGNKQTRNLTVKAGGLDFKFTTTIESSTRRGNDGGLFAAATTKMTYSCPELGIEDRHVDQALLRNGVEDIIKNVVTGEAFEKERVKIADNIVNFEKELAVLEPRLGQSFKYEKELADATERLEEYTEKMKAELEAKEAKYADMDKVIKAAEGVHLDEDSETSGEGNKYRLAEGANELNSLTNIKSKEARIEELSQKLNTPIRIINDVDADTERPLSARERRAKGWYDTEKNEVVIVAPNNVNVADVENTIVHEVVGHKGLRAMVGEERIDEFVDEIYNHASDKIKATIDQTTQRMVNAEADRLRVRKSMEREKAGEDVNANYYTDMAQARIEAEAKREKFRREATEEFMSDMAGRIGTSGFEQMSRDEQTLWGRIKAKVQQFLDKFLKRLNIPKGIRLTDKDIAYILYKSWRNLRDKSRTPASQTNSESRDIFEEAKDVAFRNKTGYDADDAKRFRDPDMGLEETITKMKAEAMQANADNLQAKRDAMRAIGGNLNHLRSAMARQREYDITTVKSITDLAKVLLDNNLLDDLSKTETKRILGSIPNALKGIGQRRTPIDKLMDVMVDNQLRLGQKTFSNLVTIKGSRVDARGVEVQGILDPDGQRMAQVVRKSISLPKDDIETRIAEALNRMGSTDQATADEAAIEYSGLQVALRYAEEIKGSKAEEKDLRESLKQAKEDKDAGQMTEAAYKQYVEATEDAIRQNKIERAEAYESLIEAMSDVLGESIRKSKKWKDESIKRVKAIQHNANSDMEGRPTDEHHKNDRVQKLSNNSGVRFLLAPLGTFDQMLRMFGKKNARGEGYLWNRYMRGWVDATEKEYTGYRDALNVLDEKAREIFDIANLASIANIGGLPRFKVKSFGDLFTVDRKLPKMSVSFWDGGEMKEHELTQGNLLYIYMADKMADGRMKLRRMGITEEDIEDIKNFLDPRFIELADWMQDEFLTNKRNEYNEVHKRMFGASMAAIENYFPLKILANARLENVDVADDTTDPALPATTTGSIIKRRRNNLALDVTGANAFSVILDHLQQMERWAAFAEFNRDLNTLLSYKRFRNQVINMSSAYGAGKTLWNNFRNVCSMAAGAYRPPIAALDKAAVNIAKGVTAAKVSFRVFTALKQFLSMPAYVSDSNPMYLAKDIVNPVGAWKWSMENLPIFEKRWKSRMAGDPRLMKSDMDWKAWRSNIVQIASRIGMSPNAFVDALTVSIGAHAMYQTKLAKYLRQGYERSAAEKRAKQDATILFNQTQQSSEGAFLSTMQVDRSWLSVLFTVFRNSSMSYTRQLYDAIRNLKGRVSGDKELSTEFMAKQLLRAQKPEEEGNWSDEDWTNARKHAGEEYRSTILRDLVKVGIFGYVLQMAWNLGAYLPYLILGEDEDEKNKMWEDVMNHSFFGGIEGFTGGDVMSSAGEMALSGEANWSYLVKDMPLASDLSAIFKKMPKDQASAMNDVVNLLVQSGIGVNPQSLTDAVVAIIDACGEDAQSQRECALLIARVINCPPSQTDKIYFDELGLTGTEASKMTPTEIAERYADYKMLREAPLTGWTRDDESEKSRVESLKKRALKAANEKITGRMATEETKRLLEEYDEVTKRETELNKLKKTDREAYKQGRKELRENADLRTHNRVKRYKRDMKELTDEYLRTKDLGRLQELVEQMNHTRDKLLEDVGKQ
ncbi:MAG: hypothetical protein J1E16_04115 [Muribaculaceae bacterium]|nr:hypothetical protein [Muribaculaceae bacterium]